MSNKRFYWIKLKEEFFDSLAVKRLRRLAGGDTYTIIYLRMQLLAMKNDGIIVFEGVDGNIASEIALTLEEEEDNVKVCLQYLQANGLAEIMEGGDCYVPEAIINTGSESDSAVRMRKARKRVSASQCDADVTLPLTLSSNTLPDNSKLNDIDNIYNINNKGVKVNTSNNKTTQKKAFMPPTVEEVEAYCIEKNHEYVDPEEFVNFYASKNWYVGKNKMVNWRSSVGLWNSRSKKENKPKFRKKTTCKNEPIEESPKVGVWKDEWDSDDGDGFDEWMERNGGK